MSKFKVGDLVVLIAGPDKSDKVHVVTESGSPTYPLRVGLCTYTTDGCLFTSSSSSYMRHATADEIAASKKQKPIRRGDLVVYDGDICMVFDEHTSRYGERLIVVLDSKDRRDSVYAYIDELTRVGSIRKKIKRIKKEMEGRNAT